VLSVDWICLVLVWSVVRKKEAGIPCIAW
jgi:hypothetical protein